MMVQLRGGFQTEDQRLDRLIQFDERSRSFPVRRAVAGKPLRSFTWRCETWLDQGHEGSCVGHAFAHELAARPAVVPSMTTKYAKEKIYHPAQRRDPWDGGAYEGASPFYEGTSVLAGAQVVHHELGLFGGYEWAFSFEDWLLAIGYRGPGVAGLNWYEGMMQTDSKGFIHPTGRIVGGHAILITKVNLKEEYLGLHNSWGNDRLWKLRFEDADRLRQEDGELCIPLKRLRERKAA